VGAAVPALRALLASALSRAAPLLDLLYPPRCTACDALGPERFCRACAETLLPAPAGCPVCGVPLDEALLPALRPRRCGPCRAQAPPFALARAPFLHGGALAEAIHGLKYRGLAELARPLGVLFEAVELPRADLVCPLPLHSQKLRVRGYDQAALLAAEAGRRFRLPVAHLLVRTRATSSQVALGREQRAANLRGAFTAAASVEGLRVCLIDDVLTTGATAAEGARALLRAGAARVEVRTLSRAP
jgi:ComF family protein